MDILSFLQTKWHSRRRIVAALTQGTIIVNKKPVAHRKAILAPWDNVAYTDNNGAHSYTYDGEKPQYEVILYNKPVGVVVSHDDKHNDTIFLELPPEWQKWYYYIGRLDKDSHWLVILTNNSKLVSYFSHPRNQWVKLYEIRTSWPLSKQDIKNGTQWVSYYEQDTGKHITLQRDACKPIPQTENEYAVTLHAWKKRHIRRLCSVLGVSVLDLMRVQFWPWKLWNIELGQRETISLSPWDVESLLGS